jgi:hypothetical protein
MAAVPLISDWDFWDMGIIGIFDLIQRLIWVFEFRC